MLRDMPARIGEQALEAGLVVELEPELARRWLQAGIAAHPSASGVPPKPLEVDDDVEILGPQLPSKKNRMAAPRARKSA
jgi:hypothetical protein